MTRDEEQFNVAVQRHMGGLNLDGLLYDLLDQTKAAMGADTATILLLDAGGSFLAARAARGVEEEVRQGVRIRLGEGFAGRIAAQRTSLLLDRVDPSTVANPVLWEKGIHSLAGVPLLDGARLVGVLHVGRFSQQAFQEEDLRLLEARASGFGKAIKDREAEIEHIAARVLQKSLMPSALPVVSGVQFGARYVPAEEGGVGGDWYDAFRLPNGDLWFMVGDVEGHGFEPAIVMGRIRAALRSFALVGRGPADVLALANRKLQIFDAGYTATAMCAVLREPYDDIEIASAGHLPPVLSQENQPAQLLDIPTTTLLGVENDISPATVHVPFAENSVLIGYTDGLVERRNESLDTGFERLVRSVENSDPEVMCRKIMDDMIGNRAPRDDIAMIAMRRIGQGRIN